MAFLGRLVRAARLRIQPARSASFDLPSAKANIAVTTPAFFAWEALAFDSIAPGQVLVTGGFLWQSAGQPDTARFIYAALLEAVDSGLAIRFEHETARPAQ